MADNMKCLKATDGTVADKTAINVGESTYSSQAANKEEIKEGYICRLRWRVMRQCDGESEMQSIPFDELIFKNGKCIGIYHADIIMLFDDENTHEQKKWVGEVVTGHDQGYDVYETYSLIRIRRIVNTDGADEAQEAYDRAEKLYNDGKYEDSIEWYEKAALLGHEAAINALGFCYLYGVGVAEDMDIAAELFRQALAHGNMKAAGNLSRMQCLYGYKMKNSEAFRVAKLGAEAGNIYAFVPLAYCYYYGTGCAKNEKLAAYWACRSYEYREDLPEAYKLMAFLYREGCFFPKVISMAKYCYLKLTEMGADFSGILDTPEFKTVSPVEPIIPEFDDKSPDFFTQECPRDLYTEALHYLGYRDGYAPIDAKKAEEFLTKAAEQGYTKAQYSLGIRYVDSMERSEVRYYPDGSISAFPCNNELGCDLIRKAAECGDYDAIEAMSVLCFDDVGIDMYEYEHYQELKKKFFGK